MQLRKIITSWLLLFAMVLSAAVMPAAADTVDDGAALQSELADESGDAMDSGAEAGLSAEKKTEEEEEIEVIEDRSEYIIDESSGETQFVFEEETAGEVTQPKSYTDNTEFLSALGLFRFADRSYSDSVKRSEFACMIMDLLASEEYAGGALPFGDVTSETAHADAIRFVFGHGLMNGVSSERFCPEENITYMQALKTVLNALGYSEPAISQGGYPTGYMKLAQKLGLMKNVPGDYNAPLSFEAAAVLLCLAAETELCEMIFLTPDSTHYAKSSERLLINVYHNIYTDRGIMTDNGRTAVNGKTALSPEEVLIGGRELFGAANPVRYLIGHNLTYYYRDDAGTYTLLYAYEDSRYNDTVTLYAQQIETENPGFSKTRVVANVDDRLKTYNIDVYANLIYNGIFDATFTKNSYDITEGTITLIDADGDNDYELVCVEEYTDIVVGNHIKDNRISSLYSIPGYNAILYKDCDTVIFEDAQGNEISPQEVFPKNILSVYRSKNDEMIRFVQSTATKTISVDSISENDDALLIEYEGEVFKISDNYVKMMKDMPDSYPRPELGTTYDVYLNFENKIVMLDQTYGKKQYAYLLAIAKGEGIRSDEVQLKLHLETDDTVVVTAKKKLSINGEEGRDPNELLTNGDLFVDEEFVPQLVSVVLNGSGELKSIETDNDANDDFFILDPNGDGVIDAEEKEKIDADKDNYSVRYRPGEFSLDYYSGVGVGGAQYKAMDFVSVNGCVCVTEDTKIFLIRHNSSDLQTTDEEEIDVITYGEYTGGWLGNSTIKAYDCDITWEAGAVVVTETYTRTWTLFFVNDTAFVTDAYGETKQRISGYFGTYGYYTFREYEEDVFKKAVQTRYPGSDGRIKKGDVLMLGFSASMDIASARLLYSPERDNDPDYSFIDIYNNSTATDKINRLCVESMLTMGRLCTYKDGRFGIFTKSNPDYVPNEGFRTKPIDNATDTYWVHSADKSTYYFHYDCQTGELKEITQYDIAANCDFYTGSIESGGYGIASFENYPVDTKCFIMRQNGIVRIVYLVTGGNW